MNNERRHFVTSFPNLCKGTDCGHGFGVGGRVLARGAEAGGEYGYCRTGVEGVEDELRAWVAWVHAAEFGVFRGDVVADNLGWLVLEKSSLE